jgi:hypothetical protein
VSRLPGRGLELDPVGALQLLDPVVLDGEAVAFGEGVVVGRRGLVVQHRGQLLEVVLQPVGGEDLHHLPWPGAVTFGLGTGDIGRLFRIWCGS